MLLPRRSRTSLLYLFGSGLSCGTGHTFFPSHPVSFILFSPFFLPTIFRFPVLLLTTVLCFSCNSSTGLQHVS